MLLLLLTALVGSALAAPRTCHGDVTHLSSTGIHSGGVAGSDREVEHDLPYLEKHRACYQSTADSNCIQASVIAAIASRESRGGSLLQSTGGYGDNGHAWGIMQCDLTHSGLPCKNCGWDTCCHIEMMVKNLLVPYINTVKSHHSGWTQDQALQGGVAAYNCGPGNIVAAFGSVDSRTTGHDYSNDVIARAKYLHSKGWN